MTLPGKGSAEVLVAAGVGRARPRGATALQGREDEPVIVRQIVRHPLPLRLGIEEPQESPHDYPAELSVYTGAQLLARLC